MSEAGERRNVEPSVSSPIIYRVNLRDEIEFVSPTWAVFARQNDAPQLASNAIGLSLWQQISGPEVRQIYLELFDFVRTRNEPITFPFRCDSPGLRREMRMTLRPLPSNGIELYSETLAQVPHVIPKMLLSVFANERQSSVALRMCAWCKAIFAGDKWVDIQAALETIQAFLQTVPPQITHTICENCYSNLMTLIQPQSSQT